MRRAMQKLIDLSLVEPGYTIDSWRQHIVLRTYTLLQMAIHNAHDAIQLTIIQRTVSWTRTHIDRYSFSEMHGDYRHIEYIFGQSLLYDPASAVAIAFCMGQYHDAVGQYHEQLSWSTQLLHCVEQNEYTELFVDTYTLAAMDLFAMGIHTGERRVEYFQQGYALFQRANQYRAQQDPHTIDPHLANKFGIALQEYATLPNVDRLQILDEAVALYAHIRNIPGIPPGLYASICQNYANTLAARAEYMHPHSAPDIEAAIAACDEGIRWLPQTDKSYHFIGLHMTKSSIYADYADIAVDRKAALLTAAYDSSSDALHHLDEHDDPQRYARFMMNRANLCTSFIEVPHVDHHKYLNKALECIKEALKYRTDDRVPLEFSWTKHNQAYLLRNLATLEGVDRYTTLQEALTANHEALRFRTKESVPEHFMRTQYQQAEIDRDLADISPHDQRIAILHHGITACDHVLDVCVQYPDHWRAAISDVKSSLLYRLADALPEQAATHIAQARTANDIALHIYADTDHEDLAEVWLNRMQIEYIAHRYQVDQAALHNLNHATKSVLEHTTHTTIRESLLAQIFVEIAHITLALTPTPDQRQQALELAQKGLAIAQSLHHSPLQLKAHHAMVQAIQSP
jgi:tetratricopeptide (TPR) repeat protein